MKLRVSFHWPTSSGVLRASLTFHIQSGHCHQIKLMHMGIEVGVDIQLPQMPLNVIPTPQERRVDTMLP